MAKLEVTLTISDTSVHISQPGHSGPSFDTGEDGDELGQAMLDAARELMRRYRAIKEKETA